MSVKRAFSKKVVVQLCHARGLCGAFWKLNKNEFKNNRNKRASIRILSIMNKYEEIDLGRTQKKRVYEKKHQENSTKVVV